MGCALTIFALFYTGVIVFPETDKKTAKVKNKKGFGASFFGNKENDFSTSMSGLTLDFKDKNANSNLASLPKTGIYYIQAGSFPAESDANYMRAQLILLNLDASVKRINMGNDRFWYRVVIGPLYGGVAANGVQAYLQEKNIDSVALMRAE